MSHPLVVRRYHLLAVLRHATSACCIVESKTHTPNLAAIKEACDEIRSLIPAAKHSEFNDPEEDPQYITPFSRGVARVLECLKLLDRQIPLPPKDQVTVVVKTAITGTIGVCTLALLQQMENDGRFARIQPTTA